jgi:hypothetical protein
MAICTGEAGKAYMGNVGKVNIVDKRVDLHPRDVLTPHDILLQYLLLLIGCLRFLAVAGFAHLDGWNTCLVPGPNTAVTAEAWALSPIFLGIFILKDMMASTTTRFILQCVMTFKAITPEQFSRGFVFVQLLKMPFDILRLVVAIEEVSNTFCVIKLQWLFDIDLFV